MLSYFRLIVIFLLLAALLRYRAKLLFSFEEEN